MEKLLLRQFQREAERQSQFAMIALQDMEEASANSDGKLFWYSAQGLAYAVERISLLLWPAETRTPGRGAALRESLGVDEDSPLASRDFVGRFLRFDERLEEWYTTSEHHRFFDSYTEPLDVLAETKPGDRFRGYDVENNALILHGEYYPLSPISEALEKLASRAEAESQKPRFDLDA